jgi:hypothetical protein
VIDLLFWALLRFFILLGPLAVAIVSARRAFLSVSHGSGRSAPVWMAFAGFAAVSGASLLPWAMHLQPVNPAALMLSAIAVTLWPVLGLVLRRPATGYRAASAAQRPVFRHAQGPAPYRSRPDVAPPEGPPGDPWLPFLPSAPPSRLQ